MKNTTMLLATVALSSVALFAQAAPTMEYECSDESIAHFSYPDTEQAMMYYQGELSLLKIAVSASGARYVSDQWEWWTKGDEGMLSLLSKDEKSKKSISITCQIVKPESVIEQEAKPSEQSAVKTTAPQITEK